MLGTRLVQFCALFAASWCLAEAEMSVRKESARFARTANTDAYAPSLNDDTSFTEAEGTSETKTAILDINGCFPFDRVKQVIPYVLLKLTENPFGMITSKTILNIIDDLHEQDKLCLKDSFRVKQRVQYEYTDERDLMRIRKIFNSEDGFSDTDTAYWNDNMVDFLTSHSASLRVNQQLAHEDERDTIGWFLTQNNGPKTLIPGSIDESETTLTTDRVTETTDPTSTESLIHLATVDFVGCMSSFRTFNRKGLEHLLRIEDEYAEVYSRSNYFDPDLQIDKDADICMEGSIQVSYKILIYSRELAQRSHLIELIPHVFENDFQLPSNVNDEDWNQLKRLFAGLKAETKYQTEDSRDELRFGWYMFNNMPKRTFINGSSN